MLNFILHNVVRFSLFECRSIQAINGEGMKDKLSSDEQCHTIEAIFLEFKKALV